LLILADQPRHLSQPRRRNTAQQCPRVVGVRPSRQSLQRVDHRHIRFPRSVLLDADPARNPYRRLRLANRRRAEKSLHQRGLAGASRADDENDLPLAGARLGE
jgi:hypothetical protein